MCGGAEFRVPERVEPIKTYFPIPNARLPVKREHGQQMYIWGRRNGELQGSVLPVTGWARQDSLDKHKWDRFKPEFVYLDVERFMEKATHETINPQFPERKPSRQTQLEFCKSRGLDLPTRLEVSMILDTIKSVLCHDLYELVYRQFWTSDVFCEGRPFIFEIINGEVGDYDGDLDACAIAIKRIPLNSIKVS